MALTVEDGTGLANADAFVSLASCDTYHANRGNDTWTGTDSDKEEAIRRATQFVSTFFTWKGQPNLGRDQALQWPRYGVIDRNGWAVDTDEVPREVVDATCEAALRELVTPGFFTPDVTMTDRVKMEQVGPIKIEYADLPASADQTRPVVLALRDILRGLILSGGNSMFGRASRA